MHQTPETPQPAPVSLSSPACFGVGLYSSPLPLFAVCELLEFEQLSWK